MPHFAVRPGSEVRALPDGMVHIAEPFCGTEPDPHVLWYCMDATGGCAPCGFAPYATPVPPPAGYPNPNRPTSSGHSNVARYWRGDPVFYIYIDAAATNSGAAVGINALGIDPFNGALGANQVQIYTFLEFLWDACYTMAKYSALSMTAGAPSLPGAGGLLPVPPHPCIAGSTFSIPSSMGSPHSVRSAIYGGIAGPGVVGTDVDRAAGPYNPANFALNGLIWHTSAGGPTGNGASELMLMAVPAGLGVGLASMIMDPLSGRITECDLIWNTASPGVAIYPNIPGGVQSSLPPCAGGLEGTQGSGGGPSVTTAIEHEIGHFFGLDHTNLHPGVAGAPPASYQPPATGGAPASAATYTNFFELPGMVGAFSGPPLFQNPGFVAAQNAQGFWRTHPARPLHPDEIAGMAELYPRLSPTSPYPDWSQPLPLINVFGRIEGVVVSDELPGSVFGLNVFPLPVAGPRVPEVGKLVGTDRPAGGGGVVGKSDTATGAPCSGQFRIGRVTAGAAYDLRIEPVESLGFAVTPPATTPLWGEWIYDVNNNPLNNLPWAVGVEGSVSRLLQPYSPHAASLGSLYIAPGTVVENLVVLLAPGNSVATEAATRPVVQLDRRAGRPSPFAGSVITATVQHDYELDFNSAVWQVAGGATTPVDQSTIATNQPANPAGATGPWTTSWTHTLSNLIPASGTVVLRFLVRESGYDGTGLPHRPPQGIVPVFGVNEVRF